MKQVTSFRLIKSIALGTVIAMSAASVAHADDVNIKTMIPGVPQIDAEAYILIDYNSGKVLAEMNADARRDPASLTKMMTSYVIGQALKAGKIGQDDLVTVGQDAWATGNPVFKGSSLMFLKPGDRVPVSKLTRGINLQSGNDACVAMADYVAGSQDAFVNLMNTYVSKLGLQNTHFQTVHGLDAQGQYSSARDMALIGQALIRDVPDEYAIYKEKEFTFNNIRQMNRPHRRGGLQPGGFGDRRPDAPDLRRDGRPHLQRPRSREQETADLGLPLLRNRGAAEGR